MINAQLQNILYRYANTKGVGLPLTAEEMLNAISSWLVDTLPECIDVEITMLPVRSTPTVTLTGQGTPDNHYLFSFGIPEAAEINGVTINDNGELVFTLTDGSTIQTEQVMPTITIGTISEGAVGSAPVVEVTGTAPNFILNFTFAKNFAVESTYINENGQLVIEYNDGTSFTSEVIVPSFTVEVGSNLDVGATPTVVITGTAPNYTITYRFPEQYRVVSASIVDRQVQFTLNDGTVFTCTGDIVPYMSIGTVTTGDEGTSAEASITGTAPDFVLNLTIPRGDTGATGATPDISMSATVDDEVGTPSVEVTKSGTAEEPSFALAFHNLKGETGTTPDISMSATVDAEVGTPSVEVTKSGTAEEPNFALAFHNLKGATGEAGQSFNFMGTWVSENEYHEYDVVTYEADGATTAYICISSVTGSSTAPPDDTEHWSVFVAPAKPNLYVHNLTIASTRYEFFGSLQIINNDSTEFTVSALAEWLSNNGFTSNVYAPCSGGAMRWGSDDTLNMILSGINVYSSSGGTSLEFKGACIGGYDTGIVTIIGDVLSYFSITDTVTAIS